jgi:hypothetical protein
MRVLRICSFFLRERLDRKSQAPRLTVRGSLS